MRSSRSSDSTFQTLEVSILKSLTAVLWLLLLGPSLAVAGDGSFTLFHTNDLHARFLPHPASWRDDKAPIGGFEAIDHTLQAERAKVGASLYLDAGDFMTGTPISDLEHRGAKGGAIVEFYNRLELDAMAIGNHEFDHPLENIPKMVEIAEFPILGANLFLPDGSPYLDTPPFLVFEQGGVRIGVIGITTEELDGLVSESKKSAFKTTTGVDTIRKLVPTLDPLTDLIIVVSHEGVEIDREIAHAVDGIDIIVGGHSHTRLPKGERVNGVLILQAGSNGRYVGRADLVVQDDRLASADCQLVPTWATGVEGSSEVQALVAQFEKQIEDEFGVVIAESTAKLGRCYYCESDLGNWLSDRLREVTGTDVALINSGGIRKDLLAGPVRRLDIQEILPFGNVICKFECSGTELAALIQHNAIAEATEDHGILQVSGIEYSWAREGENVIVPMSSVRGRDIDPARIYTVSTVDFVAKSQPEKYLGFVPAHVEVTELLLNRTMMEATEELGKVEPPTDDRVQIVSAAAASGTGE